LIPDGNTGTTFGLLTPHLTGDTGHKFYAVGYLNTGVGKVVTQVLIATTLAFSQKSFGDSEKGQIVFRFLESMAFIRVEDIGHWNALAFHGFDNLVRFSLFHPRVIRALTN